MKLASAFQLHTGCNQGKKYGARYDLNEVAQRGGTPNSWLAEAEARTHPIIPQCW